MHGHGRPRAHPPGQAHNARQRLAMMHAAFGNNPGGQQAGFQAMVPQVQQMQALFPAPAPPLPEPAGLPPGGIISVPCTAVQIDTNRADCSFVDRITGDDLYASMTLAQAQQGGVFQRQPQQQPLHQWRAYGVQPPPPPAAGGAQQRQKSEYDKYVIHQQPEPYSMCAPSEDILLWVARGGQELVVVNTRLQVITKIHQLKTGMQTVGFALSSKCAMYTTDTGFVIIISPVDKSFRLIYEHEVRITINGQPLGASFGPVRANRSRALAGKATYLLDDKNTLVHLLADPPLALYFRISDIKESLQRRESNVAPYQIKDLSNLPSQVFMQRSDPVESAIMMLDNRIMLGSPIFSADHLNWAWFDVKTGRAFTERVHNGAHGGPVLHPHFTLKIRVNPMNLSEIYVHVVNSYRPERTERQERQPQEEEGTRLPKAELWVMGMSTVDRMFSWKRRESMPTPDDPDYKRKLQTPIDWTHTPEGIMYVRWCDYEGIGPCDEYLCDYRNCRSFTLTRVDNTISSLSLMASRVLHGIESLAFPLPRGKKQRERVKRTMEGLPTKGPHVMMSRDDRRRAAVTGVATGGDYTRHCAARFLDNTSHVYYDGEQVYDDTEELIERQRRAISQMTKRTPFRSLFGTLLEQSTLNPTGGNLLALARAAEAHKKKEEAERKEREEMRKKKEEEEKREREMMEGGDFMMGESDDEEEMEEEEAPGPSHRVVMARVPSLRGNDLSAEERKLEARREAGVKLVNRVQREYGFRVDAVVSREELLATVLQKTQRGTLERLAAEAAANAAARPPAGGAAARAAAAADAAMARRAAEAAAAAIIAQQRKQRDEEQAGMMAVDNDENSEL